MSSRGVGVRKASRSERRAAQNPSHQKKTVAQTNVQIRTLYGRSGPRLDDPPPPRTSGLFSDPVFGLLQSPCKHTRRTAEGSGSGWMGTGKVGLPTYGTACAGLMGECRLAPANPGVPSFTHEFHNNPWKGKRRRR